MIAGCLACGQSVLLYHSLKIFFLFVGFKCHRFRYLLNKSNGDNALVGANDDARKSLGGTLKARNDGPLGGTLNARDGALDQSVEYK